jgi:hypothetical protein
VVLHIIEELPHILGSIPARQTACLEDITVRLVQNPCLRLKAIPKSIKQRTVLREVMHVGIETTLLTKL